MKPSILQTQFIHVALVLGALSFLLVNLFVMIDLNRLEFSEESVFIYPLLALWMAIVFLHPVLYKKALGNLSAEAPSVHKIQHYTSAKIIVWAMFEGLCLFSLVLLMIEVNTYFLISAVLALVMLILKRPSEAELQSDIK